MGNDDDAGAAEDDTITFHLAAAIVTWIILMIVFDLIRTKLWWVYQPRLHHDSYASKSPPPPSKRFGGWIAAVMRVWNDDDFLHYAGVDGLVIIYFLRYALDQCVFASTIGVIFLLPTYYSANGLDRETKEDRSEYRYSFSLTTVQNINCNIQRGSSALATSYGANAFFFPRCSGSVPQQWRFILIVGCAWLFTLRALSSLSFTCRSFVRLRHRYLTSKMTARAEPHDVQHIMTAMVENVPEKLRSMEALKEYFETLCGEGTVHSAQIMVGENIAKLDALCAARDRAIERLIDAHSIRARLLKRILDDQIRERERERTTKTRKTIRLLASSTVELDMPRWLVKGSSNETGVAMPRTAPLSEDEEAPTKMINLEGNVLSHETLRQIRSHAVSRANHELEEAIAANSRERCLPAKGVPTTTCRERAYDVTCGSLTRMRRRRREFARRPIPHKLKFGQTLDMSMFFGYSGLVDYYYVPSIPFYEQLAMELNACVLREHFARMAVIAQPSPKARRSKKKKKKQKKRRRGCFWVFDSDSESDEEEEHWVDNSMTSVERRRHRREIVRREQKAAGADIDMENGGDSSGDTTPRRSPPAAVSFDETSSTSTSNHRNSGAPRFGSVRAAPSPSIMGVLTREPSKAALMVAQKVRRTVNDHRIPLDVRDVVDGIDDGVSNYLLCGRRLGCWTAVRRAARFKCLKELDDDDDDDLTKAFQPSSTAFVTFLKPTASILATNALLSARPFGIEASPAPEPRDLIWENVHENHDAVRKRTWVVELFVLAMLVFWTTVVSATANASLLVTAFGGNNAKGYVARGMVSALPVVALLSIINLLPLCFQAIARFYERRKSFSDVDMSVVTRFQRFQLVNVYVSILSSALLHQLSKSWKNPAFLLRSIGENTPIASVYFAKLMMLQCATTPLWLIRAWPLVSRGYRTWTIQPPELPGMLYGWAFPKVMMTFLIFSTFWIFAPLLSVIAAVYFFLISFCFRYLLLYVHMPLYESGGQYFYHVIHYVCFGLAASNLILMFWLLTRSLFGYALIVAPLLIIVNSFRKFADDAYVKPSSRVALAEAVQHEAMYDSAAEPASSRFDATLYRQPSLRPQTTLSADNELSRLLSKKKAEDALVGGEPTPGKIVMLLKKTVSSKNLLEGPIMEVDQPVDRASMYELADLSKVEYSPSLQAERSARDAAAKFARKLGANIMDTSGLEEKHSQSERRRVSVFLDAFYRGDAEIVPTRHHHAPSPEGNPLRQQPIVDDEGDFYYDSTSTSRRPSAATNEDAKQAPDRTLL